MAKNYINPRSVPVTLGAKSYKADVVNRHVCSGSELGGEIETFDWFKNLVQTQGPEAAAKRANTLKRDVLRKADQKVARARAAGTEVRDFPSSTPLVSGQYPAVVE